MTLLEELTRIEKTQPRKFAKLEPRRIRRQKQRDAIKKSKQAA